MSTQTVPTTRQLANRLLSTLDWLSDYADTLPAGFVVKMYPDDLPIEIAWVSAFNSEDTLLHTLTFLRTQFGPGAPSALPGAWISWPAEGDRPRLTVYLGGVA